MSRAVENGVRQLRKASLVVLLGSSSGYMVTFALTPLIARIYNPATFGAFASLTALAAVLVGLSTLRLEVLAQGESDLAWSERLIALAMVANIVTSVVVSLSGGAAILLIGVSGWWATLGLLVFAGSLQLIGTAILTREASYASLALRNFAQGGGLGVIQALLGLFSNGVGSLLAGFVGARLVWIAQLKHMRANALRDSLSAWRTYRSRALAAGAAAAVNSLSSQAIILLPAILLGAAPAGLIAMAIRLLVGPLSLVSQAVGAASLGELGRAFRAGDSERASRLLRRSIAELAAIGTVVCAGVYFASEWIAQTVLGPPWAAVGGVIAGLTLGAWAQFSVAPFVQLLNLMGRSGMLLRWDAARLIMLSISILVPTAIGSDVSAMAFCYSIAQVVCYGTVLLLLRTAFKGLGNEPAEDKRV